MNLKENLVANNMIQPINNLIDGVVNAGPLKMTYENMDIKLVNLLNQIDDNDLRSFHQNPFVGFEENISEKI